MEIERDREPRRAVLSIHVGEQPALHHTAHDVALRWVRDCLEPWKELGWGWALWKLCGPFGVRDSSRKDVAYARFRGHELDRRRLELLRTG